MKHLRNILKIFGLTLSGLLLLMVIALILLQQGTFNRHIVSLVNRQAGQAVNGKLEIGRMEGNPFLGFTIRDIGLVQNDTLVFAMDRLDVSYSLLDLLDQELSVNALRLSGIDVFITQRKDSTWSVSDWFITGRQNKPDDGQPLEWQVRVDRLMVDRLNAQLYPLDQQQIPSSVQLDIQTGIYWHPDSMEVNLRNLTLNTESPDWQMTQVSGTLGKKGSRINWSALQGQVQGSMLKSRGTTSLDDFNGTRVVVGLDSLDLQALHDLMPDTRLYGSTDLTLEVEGDSLRQNIDLQLTGGNQQVTLSGHISNWREVPSYRIDLITRGVDLEYWTHDPQMSSNVQGALRIQGRGIDPAASTARLEGEFDSLRWAGYTLSNLGVDLNKEQSELEGSFSFSARFGGVESKFTLKQIFEEPAYDIRAHFEHFDLSKLTGNTKLNSDVNLNLQARGKGINPDSMNTNLTLDMRDSYLLGEPVSEMHARVRYDRGSYGMEGLSLSSPYARLYLDGEGHIRGDHRLDFTFIPGNIHELMSRLKLPEVRAGGRVSGRISGQPGSLYLEAGYDLKDIEYDTMKVKRMAGDVQMQSVDSLLSAKIDLRADSSLFSRQAIQQITLEATYQGDSLNSRLDVRVHDSLELFAHTGVRLQTIPVVHVPELRMVMDSARWDGGSDSTRLMLGKDSVAIHHLALRSGSQQVTVDGVYAFRGRENLKLQVKELDLSGLSAVITSPYRLHGRLDSRISLTGTASAPKLEGLLIIHQPGLDTLRLRQISTNLTFRDSLLRFQGQVDAGVERMIHADMQLPVPFTLTDSFSLPDRATPIRGKLVLDSLNLGVISPFLESRGMSSSGLLQADVEIGNTLGEPSFTGGLELNGATFRYPAEGIDYKDINIKSRFDNRRFELTQALVRSGRGTMKISGYTELGFPVPGKASNLQLQITGKDFEAVNSSRIQAVINPSITLEGSLGDPTVKGNLEVSQSLVNVDAFRQQLSVRSENPNPPLLVDAMEDTITLAGDSLQRPRSREADNGMNFYRNLNGTFNIRIPGNTWVRGSDMNFELEGNLKAIKKIGRIDLFGTLNVKRGFVEFYGKKFDFEQGQLTFTGGREINPRIDFELAYSFRDPDRELHRLNIQVTGNSQQPGLAFKLDGRQVQEKEALSYLMFGRAPDQLNRTERTSLDQQVGGIATSLAINKVSSALTQVIGSQLGMDMVEVAAGKGWKSGSVKIGKYITDDFYLSYQKNFAFDKKNKTIEADKISLEYQILRSLFLQATNQTNNSGFDLIFKKSWR